MKNIMSFSGVWDFLSFIKNPIDSRYKNIFISKQLKNIILSTVDAKLVKKLLLLEKHSLETAIHSCSVGVITSALMEKDLTDKKINISDFKKLVKSGILHDIGKKNIPKEVLHFKGEILPNKYRKIIDCHTYVGQFEILKSKDGEVAAIVAAQHHQWINGAKGLYSNQIHPFAKIVAVADVFDALTMERSYKKAFPIRQSLEIINKEKWSHFDPIYVKKLNGLFSSETTN